VHSGVIIYTTENASRCTKVQKIAKLERKTSHYKNSITNHKEAGCEDYFSEGESSSEESVEQQNVGLVL